MPGVPCEDAVIKAFKRFDTQGNGLIGRDKLGSVLAILDPAYFTDSRVDLLLGEADQNCDTFIDYEEFVGWLSDPGRTQKKFRKAAGLPSHNSAMMAARRTHEPAAGGEAAARHLASGDDPCDGRFTFMTFNVEEYYHGDHEEGLRETVFGIVQGMHELLAEQSPDVLCLEEHSLGSDFSEKEILDGLIGDLGYEYASEPTGESKAWYSGLANAVLWKTSKFQLERSWRTVISGGNDKVPGTAQSYTPRAATCAELLHKASRKRVVVCATHLLGGRFEDSTFVAEAAAGRNWRSEQVTKIAEGVKSACGDDVASVIAGDFNVMLEGFREGSPFRGQAERYFREALLQKALSMASKSASTEAKEQYTFDGFYVPFQTQVHETLTGPLGYRRAYKRKDDAPDMKTTYYTGCVDWVYIRNLSSLEDEKVVSAIDEGFSDHNPVIVTLQLR